MSCVDDGAIAAEVVSVDEVAAATQRLLAALETAAPPHTREAEAAKAKARYALRAAR